MAKVVADAILVKCADGMGQLTTYANAALGLAGGYMAHITGRLGLNGTKTIAGDTAVTTWYEDLLAEGDGDFLPSRKLDLVEGGNLEDVSAMSFTWLNTNNLAAILKSNGIELQRCEVAYFRVMTTDFVTFTFRQRWFGYIDDQPFNETKQQIQCLSGDRAIYLSAPNVPVNQTTFPTAPSDSQDKYIPIPMGRVGFSPLMNVKTAGQKTPLSLINSASYTFAACVYVDGTKKIVRIKTSGVVFVANDTRIIGKYLNQIDGSVVQTIPIGANLATNTTDPANPFTEITLTAALSGTPVLWTLANNTVKPWFFEVLDLSVTLVAADGPISETIKTSSGRPRLSRYLSDPGRYEDVSEVGFSSSTTAIEQTGFPGYSCRAKSNDAADNVDFPFAIVPKKVTVTGAPGGVNTFPAVGAAAPLLNDLNTSTGYSLHMAIAGFFPTFDQFTLDLSLPELAAAGDLKALYVIPNFSAAAEISTANVFLNVIISLADIYGRPLTTGINHNIPYGVVDTAGTTYNMLPQFYFGLPDNAALDAHYNNEVGSNLDIASLISDSKIASIYQTVRVEFFFQNLNDDAYHFTLGEIGLVGVKSVNISTEKIYGALKGRTFGSTWNGRQTPTDPILRPHEAIEKIIRDINSKATAWTAKKNYLKGALIHSVADNGHLFLCTTAGLSGTSEPAWTTTAGQTYTDSAAAWKEVGTVPVDEASFNSLTVVLFNWLIGYAMEDSKSTEEWVRMLCRHAWLAAITDRFGKLKVKSWLDAGSSLADFDKTNIYGKSLLGGITYSASSRSYNIMRFNYDWNPAAKKFNRQVIIKYTDRPAFPGPTETVSNGIDLGAYTATYAVYLGTIVVITFVTTLAHGMASGDYIDLIGNADGYNFSIAPHLAIVDAFTIKVQVSGNVFTATSTSGTTGLTRHTNRRLAWMDYVIGIRNYATGKSLWDALHAGVMVSKSLNEMPEDLGNLYFFFDPYAVDANGDLLWPDLDVGDAHATVFHAQKAVEWLPYPKPQGYIQVVDDGTFDYLENADPVTFNDDALTGGVITSATICEITQLPKTDKDPHRLQFGLIFKPGSLGNVSEFDTIDEMGATDYLDESGATDYNDDGSVP